MKTASPLLSARTTRSSMPRLLVRTMHGLAALALHTSLLAADFSAAPLEAPKWQARLQLGSLDASSSNWNGGFDNARYGGSRLLSAQLMGDYFLTGSGLRGVQGGLRATGGMLLGPLSQSQQGFGLGLSSRLGQNFSLSQRSSLSSLSPALDGGDPSTSLSYLGLGYSGQSLRGGWGFSADLGLLSDTGLGGLRLGNNRSQGMEDLMRDLRFKPVLQLGLSYSY